MNHKRSITKSIVTLAALTMLPVTIAFADLDIPGLVIPDAKPGTKCVEDEKLMREKHYDFLLHQRDKTMHQGIRTTKYSLKKCINCHVTKDKNGNYPDIKTNKHFCNSCHTYAAVTIDCFQCHATKPEQQ